MGIREVAQLLKYLTVLKFTNYFSGKWKIVKIAGTVFWLIIVSGYIYTSNMLIDAQFLGKIKNINITVWLNILVVLLILLKDFIPAYRANKNVAFPVFPLNYRLKNIINSLYEFLSPFYLMIILFFVGIFLFNYYYMTIDLAISICMILYAFSFNRLFKNILENNLSGNKNRLFIPAVISLLLLLIIIYTFNSNLVSKFIIAVVSFMTVSSLLIIIITNRTNVYIKQIPDGNIRDNLYLNLLFVNKKLRLPLIVGFLLKVFILALFTIGLQIKNRAIFSDYILWLFISPAIIFTYLLNNFLGYQRELFLAFELSGKNISRLLSIYITSFLTIFFIDILISFVTLIINGFFNINSVIYYLTASICFLLTGMIFSLANPKVVLNKNPFIISGNSIPFIANLVTISELGILLLIRNNWKYETILLIAVFICLGIFFKQVQYIYKKTKYKIFLRLFSSAT